MSRSIPHFADYQFAQRCLDGDETAVRTLMSEYRSQTIGVLVRRGAPVGEAEETVDSLWSELLSRDDGRSGRLRRYNGDCKLSTFLNTVAFNRWLTERRKRQRQQEILEGPGGPGPESGVAGTAGGSQPGAADAPLIEMLSAAVKAGSRRCSAEQFVVLQLKEADALLQKEIAKMFGCGEPWISRLVDRAARAWREGILAYLRERDPLLVLRWEDFLDLCSGAKPDCLGLGEGEDGDDD